MSAPSAQSADSLRLPGAFLRKLFDSTQLGIVVLDSQGNVLDANKSFREMTQYDAGEVRKLPFRQFISPSDHDKMQQSLRALLNEDITHLNMESSCVRRDESTLMTRIDARLMQETDKEREGCVVITIQDISAEYESRLVRRDLERRFDDWLDKAPIVVLRCDLSSIAAKMMKLQQQGVTDFEAVLRENVDLPASLTQHLQLRGANQFAVRTFEAKDEADMLKRWPQVFTPATMSTFVQIMQDIWNGKRYWQGNSLHRTLTGRPIHLRLSISLNLSSPEDVLVCGTEVTDLINSESTKLKLDSQLEQLQKLESLGVLAGGIAHDFNNLLQAISGNAELLQLDLSDSGSHASLDQILNATNKASALCEQMLAYAGRASVDKSWQSVNDIIEAMRSLLDASVTGEQLHVELQPNLSQTHVDSSQLRQLLLNLVTNASEALPRHDGTVSLRTYARVFTAKELSKMILAEETQAGVYAVIEVQDDGEGMSEETLSRIFDPFFTTKFTGRGLGLATVLGIVRGHGGLLSVRSKPGEGTTFRVLLPTAVTRQGEGSHEISHASVLIVDDNRFVLDTMSRMIEREGFHALRAESGQQAIQRLQAEPSIGLVVLDLTMPGMSGMETLAAIRKVNESVPVVLVSGYSVDTLEPNAQNGDYQGFLKKPFSRHKLIELLQSFLGTPFQVDDCA